MAYPSAGQGADHRASGGDVAPDCVPSRAPEYPPQTGDRGSRQAGGGPGTDASSRVAGIASSGGCRYSAAQAVWAGQGAGAWPQPCPDCTPGNSQRGGQLAASQGSRRTRIGTYNL